jgi:photosystem II stability/assembly factor-like uncharacterized protein
MKRKFGVALMATLTLWAGTAASTAKAAPRDAAATTSPCANLITGSELSAVTFFNVTNGLGVWSRNTHCGERLVSTKDAGKSWRVVGGELPAPGSAFSPMIFPTPRVGWVLGNGALFTTRDGGDTWSRVRLGGWVAAISASGSSLWAFVSPCDAAVNACNYMLRYRVEASTFTGTSWREAGLLPAAIAAEAPLVARLTPQRAVIADSPERGQIQVSFTSDGGAHWTSVRVCGSLEPNLDTVVATGSRDVLATCLGPGSMEVSPQALFRSNDGGKTWQAVGVDAGVGSPPAKNPIPGAQADAIGAASGQRLWMATTDVFYGSFDGGKTWFQLPGISFEGGGSNASFSFLSPAVGWMLVPTIGLWRTTDGKSWHEVLSPLPRLEADGIGPLRFGLSKTKALTALRLLLGAPNGEGINAGCGPNFTEVAWYDLIAEFRFGRFTGYRFIEGGWPLTTPGSPKDRVTAKTPTPALKTALGITLGSTLGELRPAYGKLKRSGAVKWTASNGLIFVESSSVRNSQSPADKIVEIKIGTCGSY